MSRYVSKTAQLSLDTIKGIKKLYNGDLHEFYCDHLMDQVSRIDFYEALRGNPITDIVDNLIDQAYDMACIEEGISHDTIAIVPDLETLVHYIAKFGLLEEHKPFVQFYSKQLSKGRVKLVQGLKQILTNLSHTSPKFTSVLPPNLHSGLKQGT